MKVTVIGPTYPFKGGISHFTTLLVKELRKKNTVQFLSWKRQYPSFLYPVEQKDTKSTHLIKENANFILDFINPLSWVKTFLEIKKVQSDLLIINWVTPIQSPIYFIIAVLIKHFTPTEIMYICHNVLPHERKFYDITLTKLAFFYADSFIVHSEEDKMNLKQLVKNKRIILGFLPIFSIFTKGTHINIDKTKKEINLQKKVLLFFGYIRPYKGLIYLLKAMPKILQSMPDTSLLVVGEFWSKDKKEYLDLVRILGIQNQVVFIDKYIPNEEVEKYFKISDVVVLPYISATQSAVIQTAYYFDKPVISTSVGGLSDVIAEGLTGYFIKTKDPVDIAKKVELFYQNLINSDFVTRYKERFNWTNYINLITKDEKDLTFY